MSTKHIIANDANRRRLARFRSRVRGYRKRIECREHLARERGPNPEILMSELLCRLLQEHTRLTDLVARLVSSDHMRIACFANDNLGWFSSPRRGIRCRRARFSQRFVGVKTRDGRITRGVAWVFIL